MANERPQNGENGHFITFVYYYSWQVGFSEISSTSTMLLVLCSSVVQDVTTWSQMFLPWIDSLQDQLVTLGAGMAACQLPDIYIYILIHNARVYMDSKPQRAARGLEGL